MNQFLPTEVVTNFTPRESQILHSEVKPGILCLAVHQERNIIVTGGVDGSIILYDKKA